MSDLVWIVASVAIVLVVAYVAGRLMNSLGTRAYSEASKVSMINRYLVWRDRGPDEPRDPD